jgi:acetolactate synthase-1/2/3 large subunit
VFTNAAIERPLVEESDLIVSVGLDPVELLPRPWSYRQPVVRMADPTPLEAWLPDSAWDSERIRTRVDDQRRAMQIPTAGLSAQRVIEIGAARLARDCRVTVDAGAHMFPATMLWPVFEPSQMLISNGLSTMGFALPAAIGAALADPGRPVVALTGDGGLAMCIGELLTAVRERLRIMTIVFSDASLSLIEIKQQARGLAPSGVALGGIDWIAVARGFGAVAFGADDEASLERAIDAARPLAGPSLIAARIDRTNYPAVLRAIRG